MPAEDVLEELTETDEDEAKKPKAQQEEAANCTFCSGTGRNAVSKQDCMFCDGTGKQKLEPKEADDEQADAKPAKEKRYRRKTPRQLAQEAIFDAMWASGLRPTETRHSPELREARRRQVELEREERRKRREARLKEEVDEQGNRHPADEEEAVTEDFARAVDRKEARFQKRMQRQAKFSAGHQEVLEVMSPDRDRNAPGARAEAADDDFALHERDTDPATVDKIAKLTEFARIGGTVEAASEIIIASLSASRELRMCFADLEERRRDEPEDYAEEVLLLLSECVASFFALGLRPAGIQLAPVVRNRVKRVRQALRDLLIGCDFLEILKSRKG